MYKVPRVCPKNGPNRATNAPGDLGAAPRGEKVKFGPYRQKKTLEASASRVVVEHRGVEPLFRNRYSRDSPLGRSLLIG